MANVDNTKLIQFYTGTALPQNPVEGHVYFIHNEGKGKLYKGSVLLKVLMVKSMQLIKHLQQKQLKKNYSNTLYYIRH